MKNKAKFFAIGAIAAIALLAFVFAFVPFTKFQFSTIGDAITQGEPTGTRLFIGGEHIHHWTIGLGIIALAFFVVKIVPLKYGMYGFGTILFADQVPHLLGLATFGA